MAKPILATDFKDDIMQEAMNGKRRYRMVNNTDGTVSFEDVTDYEQVGNAYGAGQINSTNEAVNQSVDSNKIVKELSTISAITQKGYVPDALAVKELNSSLGNLKFAQDAEGKWGYIPDGADSVIPFNSGINGTIIESKSVSSVAKENSYVSLSYTATEDCYVAVSFSGYCHAYGYNVSFSLSGGTTLLNSGKGTYAGAAWQFVLVKLDKNTTLSMSTSAPSDDWYRSRVVSYVAFK